MDTFMAWESSAAVILKHRPAATSQTIHVRVQLLQRERQMYLSSHHSRLDLSDWWVEQQKHEALAQSTSPLFLFGQTGQWIDDRNNEIKQKRFTTPPK